MLRRRPAINLGRAELGDGLQQPVDVGGRVVEHEAGPDRAAGLLQPEPATSARRRSCRRSTPTPGAAPGARRRRAACDPSTMNDSVEVRRAGAGKDAHAVDRRPGRRARGAAARPGTPPPRPAPTTSRSRREPAASVSPASQSTAAVIPASSSNAGVPRSKRSGTSSEAGASLAGARLSSSAGIGDDRAGVGTEQLVGGARRRSRRPARRMSVGHVRGGVHPVDVDQRAGGVGAVGDRARRRAGCRSRWRRR